MFDILSILGSAGFGSVVGGVFGWLGKREERANMKMKYDFYMMNLMIINIKIIYINIKLTQIV